ncbi:MAG: tandem-95 repeat protein [Gammaproteobacteria bacterium]|nr:tandem-95 repeat protein [Gammaproteobacteria bacterium]
MKFVYSLLLTLFIPFAHALDCEVYPLTVNERLFQNQARFVYSRVPLGTGPGNYSWLTWTGANDAPTLADSLVPPGNVENYTNPDDTLDRILSVDDWVQGAPGVKNSSEIRSNMDNLLGRDIVIPVWSDRRGQGANFDYQVSRFATIELIGYRLNGRGYISFVLKNFTECTSDNNPPIAESLTLEVVEDESLDITVVATDADDDPLTYRIVTPPTNGTLTGSGPDYVYTPNPGFVGSDSFSFVANDGETDSNVATASITVVEAPNNPPVAEDLTLEVIEDENLDITVVATDIDGDPLTYRVVTPPTNGTLTGDGPNYVYTPNPGFIGSDSFSFVANDGEVDSNIATATINVVEAPNSPPVAENLNVDATEDESLNLTVVATDADGDPLTYQIVTPPTNGTLTGDGPNYIYTPNPGYVGPDSFSFVANDGTVDSNIATANINVIEAPNNAPVAQNLSLEVTEDESLNLTVVATDADGDPLTYQIVSPPTNGTLTGTGPNYVYTPNPGFVGTDSFSFVANDGEIDSNIATASIAVIEAPNNPPIAEDLEVSGIEDQNLNLVVVASDADGDSLTYQILTPPTNGTLSGSGPNYVYTPNPGFTGNDSFSFVANDGTVDSNEAFAFITIEEAPNNPPVAQDLEVSGIEDENLNLVVIASDADGDPLTYQILTPPSNGTLTGSGPDYVYTPNPGFTGTDSFSFVANDGTVNSNEAFAFITIEEAPNNPPVAQDLEVNGIEDESLNLVVIASDADGDPLTYQILIPPSNGTLTGTGPDYVYTPNPGFTGTDSFSFVANDGTVNSNEAFAFITISEAPNNPPVAEDLEVAGNEGQNLNLTVIASDADGDPLTYEILTPPSNGTLTGTGPNYIYTPNPGFSGTDSFSFVANDGTVNSNEAFAIITIEEAPNNPPVAEDLESSVFEGQSLSIFVQATDPDDDPLTYQIVTQPQNGTLSGNGPDYLYTPNPGFTGVDFFEFVANDGEANSNVAVGTISVEPAPNSPPVANDQEIETNEGQSIRFTVSATDADGDALTYQLLSPPANGSLAGFGPTYVYTPDNGFSGVDSFEFVANDGTINSNIATVVIVVNEIANTPPVAQDLETSGDEGEPINLFVTATDIDNDPLTYQIVTPPSNGTISGTGPSFTYTPDPGFSGTDTFTYVANDGEENSNEAVVIITVNEVANTPPIVEDSELGTTAGQPVSFTVPASDPDGDPLTFLITSPPSGGTLTGTGPDFTYTPDPGFTGVDFFAFVANDGKDDSVEAVVIIFVE